MARKVKDVTISTKGRDFGKVFRVKEKPAEEAEFWCYDVLRAMIAGGAEVPDGFFQMPSAAMAAMGFKVVMEGLGRAPKHLSDPLLKQLMECVTYVPNPKKPDFTLDLSVQEDTIEEPFTGFQLKMEAFMLHVGFFTDEEGQISE